MIKSFEQFINESSDMNSDTTVSNLMQEVDRNYNDYPGMSTVKSTDINFSIDERKFPNFADEVELEKESTLPCEFHLKFTLRSEEYDMNLKFSVSFKGVENYDIPDPDYRHMQEEQRMGISLESMQIKRIIVKSSSLDYDSTKFGKDLGKTVLRFLLKIVKPQFDIIGDSTLSIQQI